MLTTLFFRPRGRRRVTHGDWGGSLYLEVPLSDGRAFLVESDTGQGVVRAGRGRDAVQASVETFEESLARVGQISEMIVQRFTALEGGPDHVRAEFGIKFSAETGMVVVKGTADAHFVLELEWSRSTAE
ncbi:CU044_2847 family protein [Nonomuraea sp. NPDC049758]|uniref:CU044_2847 family protein n=1 Tax=Nonomuraea sp. NPDC049758 TaxID=3154360 RepID=UPI00341BC6F1